MMDQETELEGTKGTGETRVKSGQEHVNKENSKIFMVKKRVLK